MQNFDVVIIGAGAAGLMCAIEAGKRQRKTIVLDQANKVGKKILMSGGGRCNFTNLHINADRYISKNPHFCKSALSRFTQWDFIELVKKHQIPFHEKTLGQLFCDHKSKDIVDMLIKECEHANAEIKLDCTISSIKQLSNQHFIIKSNQGIFACESLVIATGGLSIPSMGSSPFGYKIAEQFGLNVWPTRAGLVPLCWNENDKEQFSTLSGISLNSHVKNSRQHFQEDLLFTHRGLSGPAILQISSYWQSGEEISINLLPQHSLENILKDLKDCGCTKLLRTILCEYLPKRVVEAFIDLAILETNLQNISNRCLEETAFKFNQWTFKANGSEGYRTAEVTLGGVDCNTLSSKTMAAQQVPGLYFIGEVVDVTGWLGGYNFQWAWSSGWAAGQVV